MGVFFGRNMVIEQCMLQVIMWMPVFLLSLEMESGTYWPAARSDQLVQIQSRLPESPIGESDQPIWNSKKGLYSCAETWEFFRKKKPLATWFKVVWFPLAIPSHARHAFILWLVFRGALVTKEKMCGWGFRGDTLFRLCYSS
jgi:hypothetical protein